MSGVPSDIENAAVSAMRDMDLGDTAYGYSGLKIRKAVAEAILAERKRCIAAGFIIMSKKDVAEVRRQALEEAAKWLDDWSEETWGQDVSPEYAATAIRELKSQPVAATRPTGGSNHGE